MGLFTFMKDAGEKLFGHSSTTDTDSLNAHIKQVGGENMQVAYNDGKVTVSGEAESQEMKEKILLALGNVTGVEKVEEQIIVQKPSGESKMYTVKKGDTLSKISKEFYGNASKYNKIFEANRPLLAHPDKIYPGQVLRIPE